MHFDLSNCTDEWFVRAREDAVLSLSQPIIGVDGTSMSEIFVPKGTTIFIGIQGCNRDKALWGDDADEWKPERWLSPLPSSVTEARIPGIYSNMWVRGMALRSLILAHNDD